MFFKKYLNLFVLVIVMMSFTSFSQGLEGKAALVIIDMQPYFYRRYRFHENRENKAKLAALISNQLAIIELAQEKNLEIIVIEYNPHHWFKRGIKTDYRIVEALEEYSRVKFFAKNEDSMFHTKNKSTTDILKYLENHNIQNLIVMGSNGGSCVKASITAALVNHQFNVYPYSRGIADFNYKKFIYPFENRFELSSSECCEFKELQQHSEIIELLER